MANSEITLLRFQPSHSRALAAGHERLREMLQVKIPESWPMFKAAYKPMDGADFDPRANPWGTYLFIDGAQNTLVGSGGFKGGPNADGKIELGYEIAEELWNRGFATLAVKAMMDFALQEKTIRTVTAHTLAGKNASNRVLSKLGFLHTNSLSDPEDGDLWFWEYQRPG